MNDRRPKSISLFALAIASVAGLLFPALLQADDDKPADDGFVSIFDGKTLEGWDGNPAFWRVEDGAITGETTAENPTKGNTFIIWRKGKTSDFELKLEYKLIGHNSGVQYRSFEVPDEKWVVGGYQADMEAGDMYSGILYGERFRGILALRGESTVIGDDHMPTVVGSVGNSDEIQAKIKKEDWNSYHIIAQGNKFEHRINGVTTIKCEDNDTEMRRSEGILALQLHAGPAMKVQFRNIKLKDLDEKKKSDASQASKKVVFVAGVKSHGYGQHEHKAGCLLLAKALEENVPGVTTEVVTDGWPEDESVFDGAASVVVYADGGERHPLFKHLGRFDQLMKQGTGVVCIHYAVEVPAGDAGDHFLDWMGGYFEANWSINPHWDASYESLPTHAITRGVRPFKINDEWYYHMRFRPEMQGTTAILSDLPPQSTLSRPDGPHSGNPAVRQAVADGKVQHMAWATERADGGRGFGFTGGHYHWNWGNDEFRKLILNAIVWTAHGNVPEEGVPSSQLSVSDLEANQDYSQPDDYNPARIQKMLDQWNRR